MTLEELKQKVRQAHKLVIILRGVSGSGKSTLAEEISKCRSPLDVECLSADSFFKAGDKYEFNREKLGYAHASCFYTFIQVMNRQRPVIIIDNTNVAAVEAAPYAQGAGAFGYSHLVVNVRCDPALAASRNIHGVPEDVIRNAHARLATEELPKWWKVVDLETNPQVNAQTENKT